MPGLPGPRGLRASRFCVGSEDFAVLSFPISTPSLPPSLSAAEREVALHLLEGRSNAQIAASRRTSVRTVANQVASLLRKLEVRSRAEFVVAVQSRSHR
jgi:DNA-binding CsgD family transcriptional regulator